MWCLSEDYLRYVSRVVTLEVLLSTEKQMVPGEPGTFLDCVNKEWE